MNTTRIIVLMGLLLAGFSVKGQSAREISDLAVQSTNIDRMEMTASLKIMDAKGRERLRTLTTSTGKFEGVTKTLLRFTEPADVRGTALLIYDYKTQADDMWIYLPALHKTRRIVSSEKGKSFMGSEFSNADMTIPNLDDFGYQIVGEEVYDGNLCWKIESVFKDDDLADENGYRRKISWIQKDHYLARKIEFYNPDDELFKQQLIGDYRKDQNGNYFAWHMEMSNLSNGRKSIMVVQQFSSANSLSENSFSPNLLGN